MEKREYRQQLLQQLIERLHDGDDFDAVHADFKAEFENVDASEIADMEKELMAKGVVNVEDVQRLCDVHAALFEGSVAAIHGDKDKTKDLGHPTWVLREENKAITKLIAEHLEPHIRALKENNLAALINLEADLEKLWEIDTHYSVKENLWFPIMERYGITAPPQVMWGVDDEIRALIKESRAKLDAIIKSDKKDQKEIDSFIETLEEAKVKVIDMISKEENILIPMVSEVFFATDWRQIKEQTPEIGYTLLHDHPTFKILKETATTTKEATSDQGKIVLPSGSFNAETLKHLLNTLPFDITFVDSDDKVAYFSQSNERIFPRATTVIGRSVHNCHPPSSVDVVEKIISQFKSGEKDDAEFYIHIKDRYIYIRYFAVRNEKGEYLGTAEISQDIAPIQKISGDKRLLDWS